jgi:hypothetical protein
LLNQYWIGLRDGRKLPKGRQLELVSEEEIQLMSLENFPEKPVNFVELHRLRKHGIAVEVGISSGNLIAPDGTKAQVRKSDDGNAVFPSEMPVFIRNLIAGEYGLDLKEGDEKSTYVVIVAGDLDPQFTMDFIASALNCDELLQSHFCKHPEFKKQISRLEVANDIDFGLSASAFLRKAHKRDGVFLVHVQQKWSEIFTIMVALRFFVRVGDHYVMAIPADLNIESIVEALTGLAEAEDEEHFLHPERHLVTLTRIRAKNLCKRLRKDLSEARLVNVGSRLTGQASSAVVGRGEIAGAAGSSLRDY